MLKYNTLLLVWPFELIDGNLLMADRFLHFSMTVRVHIENDKAQSMSEDEKEETLGQVRKITLYHSELFLSHLCHR